jgi:hypothetical protein
VKVSVPGGSFTCVSPTELRAMLKDEHFKAAIGYEWGHTVVHELSPRRSEAMSTPVIEGKGE